MAEEGEEWMVTDLIDPDLLCWRRDIIIMSFQRDDANAICRIPLSRRQVADSMVWLHNKNGASSVQSSYHTARKVVRKENWVASLRGVEGQETWKALWRLNVPCKLKIIADDRCHCCKRVAEIAIHAIRECRAAQDVWAGSITSPQTWSTNCLDFMHLFECLMSRLLKSELELFLVQAWIIWNQRNAVVHGGQLKEPGWLNRRVAEYLNEYKEAQENLTTTNIIAGRLVWNTNGEVMVGMSAKGPYVHRSEEAEVMACRKAIKFPMEAGFSRLIIEGDSLNVIRALSDSAKNRSLLGHIYDDIKCNLRGICGNTAAHSLAKHARNLLDDTYWIEDTPPPAADALYHNISMND
ncbi:hypothetical protein ACB092_11G229600 [Castanea dentata]